MHHVIYVPIIWLNTGHETSTCRIVLLCRYKMNLEHKYLENKKKKNTERHCNLN